MPIINEPELLPCPFNCGTEKEQIIHPPIINVTFADPFEFTVMCGLCGAEGQTMTTEEEASAKWNNRSTSKHICEEIYEEATN